MDKEQIIWNLVNAGLAGLLVTVGACADGNIGLKELMIAFVAGTIVFLTKFRDFWLTSEPKNKTASFNLFKFV